MAMFEILRKKIAVFTEKLKQTVEQKRESQSTETASEKKTETIEAEPGTIAEKTAEQIEEKPEIAVRKPNSEKKTTAPTKTETKRELKAKVGLGKKVQAVLTRTITISKNELAPLLEELELSLLEADVEQEAALEIVSAIQSDLTGKKIGRTQGIDSFLQNEIRKALLEILAIPPIDLAEKSRQKKPLVILMLGPNGAGKTTTIAKLTRFFQKNGKKCVWAASDTFRAASIEQLEKHGQKLGVRVVKHAYGADPAAVAFDAIKSAEAHQLDVVLIDSAGRQETNKNLMEELKKMVRVAKPDLKIFVAESYAGQALLQQAQEFDSALNLDGFILTKMDADPKGGTLLSLLFKLKKPVLFIGTGQGYEDLEVFDAKRIVERIV